VAGGGSQRAGTWGRFVREKGKNKYHHDATGVIEGRRTGEKMVALLWKQAKNDRESFTRKVFITGLHINA